MNRLIVKQKCTLPETDAIVAALRWLAVSLDSNSVTSNDEDIGLILTNGGTHAGLTASQIHALADRMLINDVVLESSQAVVRTVTTTRHSAQYVIERLTQFIATEEGLGAQSGSACAIAISLKAEVEKGGPGCLENLPALKKSILDYAVNEFSPSDPQD